MVCALVGALVAGPLVVGAYALGSKVATNRATSAVVGAGVMANFPDGFRPNDVVTRGSLATALLRSIPRLATASFDGSATAGSSTELDTVDLRIDGTPHKIQGVLISVQLQLDHDNSLSAGCTPSFSFTKNASPKVVGGWSQEEYGGTGSGLELNVAFSVFVHAVHEHEGDLPPALHEPVHRGLVRGRGDDDRAELSADGRRHRGQGTGVPHEAPASAARPRVVARGFAWP